LWQTKSHTHTKQQKKLQLCISLDFWVVNWKTNDSAPNDCSRNDQQYALIVPILYYIYWLLHVSAVACNHQGAS
jgi:hypothetical protein